MLYIIFSTSWYMHFSFIHFKNISEIFCWHSLQTPVGSGGTAEPNSALSVTLWIVFYFLFFLKFFLPLFFFSYRIENPLDAGDSPNRLGTTLSGTQPVYILVCHCDFNTGFLSSREGNPRRSQSDSTKIKKTKTQNWNTWKRRRTREMYWICHKVLELEDKAVNLFPTVRLRFFSSPIRSLGSKQGVTVIVFASSIILSNSWHIWH